MKFTKYGTDLAAREEADRIKYMRPENAAGASAHARAAAFNVGLNILLVGNDLHGKRFTYRAGSVSGAYFTAGAMWGIKRAWHIREDGTRRLIFRR